MMSTKKISIGTDIHLYPMPVVLVGTRVEGRINFMTVAWLSRVNNDPPMMAVCINKAQYTHRGITATSAFSINIPKKDDLALTDYCGIVSGRSTDKSGLFEIFEGELPDAPMISRCPVTMECRVVQTVDLPTNSLFIGLVAAGYCDEACLTKGKPDIHKIDPVVLTMPDCSYWSVGDKVAGAWNVGMSIKKARG